MAQLMVVLISIIAACGASPPASPSVRGGAVGGTERLITDLAGAGARAVEAGSFDPTPLSGRATLLCLDGEEVRVYAFSSEQERVAAASRIDPNDASKVGTAIIAWAGNPRFWQRDRILVLYLGGDEAIESLLSSVLGPPFARGLGRLALPGTDC